MRHSADRSGFTLLEVLVASLVLSAGIGALLGTAALTIGLTLRGRQATRAVQAATTELERLRGVAGAMPGACGGVADGTDSATDGTAWRWRLTAVGDLRQASLVVSVPVPGGRKSDTLTITIWCP